MIVNLWRFCYIILLCGIYYFAIMNVECTTIHKIDMFNLNLYIRSISLRRNHQRMRFKNCEKYKLSFAHI